MAGIDGIRIANNRWQTYPQNGQQRDGNMKHPFNRDKQDQTEQSENNGNQDEEQFHIDEYV